MGCMTYKIKDFTPQEFKCFGGLGCPSVYGVVEVTPQSERCFLGACPAVFEAREITPKESRCGVGPCPGVYSVKRKTPEELRGGFGACPEIFEQNKDSYLIIGKIVGIEEARQIPIGEGRTLADKIGEGECLIKVSKKMIDKIERV